MSKYKIAGIIYLKIGMNESMCETLYLRISTQNIACSQRQMCIRDRSIAVPDLVSRFGLAVRLRLVSGRT